MVMLFLRTHEFLKFSLAMVVSSAVVLNVIFLPYCRVKELDPSVNAGTSLTHSAEDAGDVVSTFKRLAAVLALIPLQEPVTVRYSKPCSNQHFPGTDATVISCIFSFV